MAKQNAGRPHGEDNNPLGQIQRIVVVMMENRSFDHMLGYLGLDEHFPHEVDGLQNAHPNWDEQGTRYDPYPLGPGQTAVHEPGKPFDESLDPCHGPGCVKEQLCAPAPVSTGDFYIEHPRSKLAQGRPNVSSKLRLW